MSKKNKQQFKPTLKLSNFADKVHLMFRRMYADLEKQRIENT